MEALFETLAHYELTRHPRDQTEKGSRFLCRNRKPERLCQCRSNNGQTGD